MAHVVFCGLGLASTLALPMIVEASGVKAEYVSCYLPNEHPDQFRLAREVENMLGIKIHDIGIGKTPLQIFEEQNFLGNSLFDPCSRILKREASLAYMTSKYPNGATIYIGIGAHEIDREMAISKNWVKKGYDVKMPLIDNRWINNTYLMRLCDELFGFVPELYKKGFAHGNCHGACIKAGIGQWLMLLEHYPHIYAQWQETEEKIRLSTGKDVSILRETVNGVRRNLTLARLKETRGMRTVRMFDDNGCAFCEAI